MHEACCQVPLDDLGVLRARGADAASFLQGQLSADLRLLTPEHSLLSGYHNPQGRVIALPRLLRLAEDDLLCVLPLELLPTVIARLAKYVLRAKVKLADESQSWRISGLLGARAAAAAGLPAATDTVMPLEGGLAVRVTGATARWLWVRGSQGSAALSGWAPGPHELWRRAAIAAGEPQVYVATSEQFVAQMLNLDALGALSFDKGCYTGQEVIARAHYRGRVKRRLQRFAATTALVPGAGGTLGDGRTFKVVDAVSLPEGRCEFLAVVALLPAAGEEPGSEGAAPHIEAQQLPLPYPLP